jgi:hypothetical protein
LAEYERRQALHHCSARGDVGLAWEIGDVVFMEYFAATINRAKPVAAMIYY